MPSKYFPNVLDNTYDDFRQPEALAPFPTDTFLQDRANTLPPELEKAAYDQEQDRLRSFYNSMTDETFHDRFWDIAFARNNTVGAFLERISTVEGGQEMTGQAVLMKHHQFFKDMGIFETLIDKVTPDNNITDLKRKAQEAVDEQFMELVRAGDTSFMDLKTEAMTMPMYVVDPVNFIPLGFLTKAGKIANLAGKIPGASALLNTTEKMTWAGATIGRPLKAAVRTGYYMGTANAIQELALETAGPYARPLTENIIGGFAFGGVLGFGGSFGFNIIKKVFPGKVPQAKQAIAQGMEVIQNKAMAEQAAAMTIDNNIDQVIAEAAQLEYAADLNTRRQILESGSGQKVSDTIFEIDDRGTSFTDVVPTKPITSTDTVIDSTGAKPNSLTYPISPERLSSFNNRMANGSILARGGIVITEIPGIVNHRTMIIDTDGTTIEAVAALDPDAANNFLAAKTLVDNDFNAKVRDVNNRLDALDTEIKTASKELKEVKGTDPSIVGDTRLALDILKAQETPLPYQLKQVLDYASKMNYGEQAVIRELLELNDPKLNRVMEYTFDLSIDEIRSLMVPSTKKPLTILKATDTDVPGVKSLETKAIVSNAVNKVESLADDLNDEFIGSRIDSDPTGSGNTAVKAESIMSIDNPGLVQEATARVYWNEVYRSGRYSETEVKILQSIDNLRTRKMAAAFFDILDPSVRAMIKSVLDVKEVKMSETATEFMETQTGGYVQVGGLSNTSIVDPAGVQARARASRGIVQRISDFFTGNKEAWIAPKISKALLKVYKYEGIQTDYEALHELMHLIYETIIPQADKNLLRAEIIKEIKTSKAAYQTFTRDILSGISKAEAIAGFEKSYGTADKQTRIILDVLTDYILNEGTFNQGKITSMFDYKQVMNDLFDDLELLTTPKYESLFNLLKTEILVESTALRIVAGEVGPMKGPIQRFVKSLSYILKRGEPNLARAFEKIESRMLTKTRSTDFVIKELLYQNIIKQELFTKTIDDIVSRAEWFKNVENAVDKEDFVLQLGLELQTIALEMEPFLPARIRQFIATLVDDMQDVADFEASDIVKLETALQSVIDAIKIGFTDEAKGVAILRTYKGFADSEADLPGRDEWKALFRPGERKTMFYANRQSVSDAGKFTEDDIDLRMSPESILEENPESLFGKAYFGTRQKGLVNQSLNFAGHLIRFPNKLINMIQGDPIGAKLFNSRSVATDNILNGARRLINVSKVFYQDTLQGASFGKGSNAELIKDNIYLDMRKAKATIRDHYLDWREAMGAPKSERLTKQFFSQRKFVGFMGDESWSYKNFASQLKQLIERTYVNNGVLQPITRFANDASTLQMLNNSALKESALEFKKYIDKYLNEYVEQGVLLKEDVDKILSKQNDPKDGISYFPRIWDVQKVMNNKQKFIEALAADIKSGGEVSEVQALITAKETYESIVRSRASNNIDVERDMIMARAIGERTIDIKNPETFVEFQMADPIMVMDRYTLERAGRYSVNKALHDEYAMTLDEIIAKVKALIDDYRNDRIDRAEFDRLKEGYKHSLLLRTDEAFDIEELLPTLEQMLKDLSNDNPDPLLFPVMQEILKHNQMESFKSANDLTRDLGRWFYALTKHEVNDYVQGLRNRSILEIEKFKQTYVYYALASLGKHFLERQTVNPEAYFDFETLFDFLSGSDVISKAEFEKILDNFKKDIADKTPEEEMEMFNAAIKNFDIVSQEFIKVIKSNPNLAGILKYSDEMKLLPPIGEEIKFPNLEINSTLAERMANETRVQVKTIIDTLYDTFEHEIIDTRSELARRTLSNFTVSAYLSTNGLTNWQDTSNQLFINRIIDTPNFKATVINAQKVLKSMPKEELRRFLAMADRFEDAIMRGAISDMTGTSYHAADVMRNSTKGSEQALAKFFDMSENAAEMTNRYGGANLGDIMKRSLATLVAEVKLVELVERLSAMSEKGVDLNNLTQAIMRENGMPDPTLIADLRSFGINKELIDTLKPYITKRKDGANYFELSKLIDKANELYQTYQTVSPDDLNRVAVKADYDKLMNAYNAVTGIEKRWVDTAVTVPGIAAKSPQTITTGLGKFVATFTGYIQSFNERILSKLEQYDQSIAFKLRWFSGMFGAALFVGALKMFLSGKPIWDENKSDEANMLEWTRRSFLNSGILGPGGTISGSLWATGTGYNPFVPAPLSALGDIPNLFRGVIGNVGDATEDIGTISDWSQWRGIVSRIPVINLWYLRFLYDRASRLINGEDIIPENFITNKTNF